MGDQDKIFGLKAEPYPLVMNPDSTALLIIDMQREFLEPGGFGEVIGKNVELLQPIIGPCKSVLYAARDAGTDIYFTREGHAPDLSDAPKTKIDRGKFNTGIGDEGAMGRMLVQGEPGNQIITDLTPLPNETIIDKPGKGAFYNTKLGDTLRKKNMRTLIVCGITTEGSVHTSVREANDFGFEVAVLSDCVGSYSEEFHRVGLEMVKAQMGIFGWVAESPDALEILRQWN